MHVYTTVNFPAVEDVSYMSREAQPRRNVYWPRPSVCLSVCLSVYLSVPPRILTLLHDPGVSLGNGRDAL